MKKIFIISILFVILILILHNNKTVPAKLILYGDKIINLEYGEKYKEPGYKALNEKNKDVTKSVKRDGNVDSDKEGTYKLTYYFLNNKKEKVLKYRFIKVKKPEMPIYKDEYDNIDNRTHGWWSNNKFDHQRPTGGANINELKKYNAYFMGPDKKVIYLTYDEGSNDNYVKEIVEVLNKNDVKATFFLCRKYIEMNPDLIKHMASSGHSIGNHTVRHLSMPTLANKERFNEFLNEIKAVEETYYKITLKEMDKVYREPRGEWSFRDLQIMKDLGYKTFFYSADYKDFAENVTKEKALAELTKRYHNGAIYLMHPKNRGNYEALESFINEMKKQGFSFDLVKNIN